MTTTTTVTATATAAATTTSCTRKSKDEYEYSRIYTIINLFFLQILSVKFLGETRTTLMLGAIPSFNLPKKSIPFSR